MLLLKSLAAIALAAPLFSAESATPGDAVAHEWGTFTSVAGEDGAAVEWLALSGPSDLPCFVNRYRFEQRPKWGGAKVRMETPVVYFYAPRNMTFSVTVDFPKGLITEWYPQAQSAKTRIQWNSVEITPDAQPQLPVESGASHYYAAREADSSPLRAGSQVEKLLF